MSTEATPHRKPGPRAAGSAAAAADHRVPCYRRYPLHITHGKGCRVFSADGKSYLDFLSGIGVNALGHAHPRLTAALREQLGTLVHTSNLYEHPLQEAFAARVAAATGLDLVFFSNSGAESVECALKLARRYQQREGHTCQRRILALEDSFHGRSLGALSVTWNSAYRDPFRPLNPAVGFVPPEDVEALEKHLRTGRYAALIIEPIQGESGVHPLSGDYLRVARSLTQETGTLLILDEIQCGAGRTGTFLACESSGVAPDIVCLAKPIGAGLPLGATVARRTVGEALTPGDHGSTFGGGPLACRAGLVFLEELFDHGLLAHVKNIGNELRVGLEDLHAKHPCVHDVRGQGLMQALVLEVQAGPVVDGLHRRGLLANATAGNVLRFLPPYVLGREELAEAVSILDAELQLYDSTPRS